MKPYTFKQSVAFSDHNFQSRIGDTCVFHVAKESLVVYREDSLIANFPLRKIALEAMEEKGWLVPTTPEVKKEVVVQVVIEEQKPEPETVVVEEQELSADDEVPDQEGDESPDLDSLDETEIEVIDETPQTEVEVKKQRGGRPKKK